MATITDSNLVLRKARIWERFQNLCLTKAPTGLSRQALYNLGLQKGYGEGLVDGVDLGLDVGMPPSVPSSDDVPAWGNN